MQLTFFPNSTMLEMHDESAQNKQLLKIDIEANDMK